MLLILGVGGSSGCVTRVNPAAEGQCCVNGVCRPPNADAGERTVDGGAIGECETIDASPDAPGSDGSADAPAADAAGCFADGAQPCVTADAGAGQ